MLLLAMLYSSESFAPFLPSRMSPSHALTPFAYAWKTALFASSRPA